MSTPDGGKEITLAIRIDTARHAQLTWIAELRGTSLKAECFKAVDAYIEAAKQDPGLMARANAARAAIEEEARARQEAIDNLFIASPPPPPAQDEPDVTQAETDGPPGPRPAPRGGGGGGGGARVAQGTAAGARAPRGCGGGPSVSACVTSGSS
ncbi:hypothetical protein [Nocardia cyriacigeorgica]|uniref:hypothetical protein n=1 Tax=Nocardia cyriacigeorgica TaxID=135487 RepID=UPI002458EB49|nr:hypothetical protein [Nocardia cyriacigeorgica]